mgnify:CR=1 FL=1
MLRRFGKMVAVALVSLVTVAGCKSTESAESGQESEQTAQTSQKKGASSETDGEHGGAKHHEHGEHRHGEHAETAEHAEGHGRHHEFDQPEKYAERWNSPKRDKWQKPDEVLEALGVEKGMTVVDLGTGTGYFLPHMSKAVGEKGRVLGLDISEKMLEYVKNNTLNALPHDNVETRLVERTDPKLEAGSVDRILMVNTWHHVQDRVAYAEKLFEALKPGGKFADVDYTMETDMGPPKKIRLKPKTVAAELEKAGFQAKVVEESLPKQYMVVATKPAK